MFHVNILVFKWLYARIFKKNHINKYLWKVFKVNNYYAFIILPYKVLYFLQYDSLWPAAQY